MRASRGTLALVAAGLAALAVGAFAVSRDGDGGGLAPAPAAGTGLGSLPGPAQPVVSSSIGASSPAYYAHPAGAGYRLRGGGGTANVGPNGAGLSGAGTAFGLTVAGVGRPSHLTATHVVALGAAANRVSLDRGGLSEWYEAGPMGIEQGFALDRRPAGDGPVTLDLQLSGKVRASADGPGSVLLSRPGAAGLVYGRLSATDADGAVLRSALSLRGRRLVIQVWDDRASYPIRIDPTVAQADKLTPSDETGNG